MADINYKPIENKIKVMIQDRIKELGLVKSGKLLNSISVSYSDSGFKISAEDYFEYLDEKYNISEYVLYSDELTDFIEDYLVKELENNI